MTKVEIHKNEGHITYVLAEGHTGYAHEGEDIVCSALSSVIQTAIMGLLQVAKINCNYTIIDATGSLELSIPHLEKEDRHNADMILDTMLCGIADLYESYSDYIELEVK